MSGTPHCSVRPRPWSHKCRARRRVRAGAKPGSPWRPGRPAPPPQPCSLCAPESAPPPAPAPACRSPRSRALTDAFFNGSGTSPAAMRMANPSTMAVFPTPGSPVRMGLFCRRRIRMSTICRISASRPRIGSIPPAPANPVKSTVKRSRALSGSTEPDTTGLCAAESAGGGARRRVHGGGRGGRTGLGGVPHKLACTLLQGFARDCEERRCGLLDGSADRRIGKSRQQQRRGAYLVRPEVQRGDTPSQLEETRNIG